MTVSVIVDVDVSVSMMVESADTWGVSVLVIVSVGSVTYPVDVGFSISVLTPFRVVTPVPVVVVVL